MSLESLHQTATTRRGVLKRVGVGALGVATVAATQSARATTRAPSTDRDRSLFLELAIGNNKLLSGWEEFDDYHDIENKGLSGFDVKMTIRGGGGSTLLCQTAILQGSSLESQEGSGIEYADDLHEDYHGYMSGGLDGRYTLFGTVTDVRSGESTTASVDFTVR